MSKLELLIHGIYEEEYQKPRSKERRGEQLESGEPLR
jgi:hypothetical protein